MCIRDRDYGETAGELIPKERNRCWYNRLWPIRKEEEEEKEGFSRCRVQLSIHIRIDVLSSSYRISF